jgi:hypothetical protein
MEEMLKFNPIFNVILAACLCLCAMPFIKGESLTYLQHLGCIDHPLIGFAYAINLNAYVIVGAHVVSSVPPICRIYTLKKDFFNF